ncbi:MAG TPA: response regulator transcription factor [Gemmataceae bacterium]|nr:response regulator transcription factor [Gemmataceae bacterium]
MPVKLLLADDHQIVRQGVWAVLRTQPGFHLAGEAADGPDAVRQAERLQPDVLVLDLMLPGLNGLEVARQVGRRSPRTRIVMLSMHAHEAYVGESLRAGASAYVLKEAGADELLLAIRSVLAGRRYFSPPLSEPAVPALAPAAAPLDPYDTLTGREREVLQMTAEGQSGGEIARRLFISPRTVESHRANLLRKLGLRNLKEMVRYAVERGLLADDPSAVGARRLPKVP